MKHGPATKLYKRNKAPPKKFDDDIMLPNYDVIVISPVYDQFGAIWQPGSGHIVYKTFTFINSNLL